MAPKKGFIPWNKGLTGKQYLKHYPNGIKINKFPKGNKFAKGKHPKHEFKKGDKPWNYIDGRSRKQTWNRYGTDWKRIRQQVLIRDNGQCQICGRFEGRLEIHHKTPFLISKDNSLDNLITLCAPCHRRIESEITGRLIKMKVERMLKK